MNFPIMNKRSRQGVSIPDLAGGINLRDSLTTVQDNQLTDAVNMWFRDGALRTRPSFVTDIGHSKQHDTWMYETRTIKTFSDISIKIGDNEGVLACVRTTGISGMEQTRLDFFLVGDVFSLLGYIEIGQKEGTYFVFKHENILYCLCSDYTIYKKGNTDNTKWSVVPDEELAHTCFINGLGGSKTNDEFYKSSFIGEAIDGLNIISPYYKAIYSTVNTSVLSSEEDEHLMAYKLPIWFEAEPNKKITVSIKNKIGEEAIHSVTFTEETLALVKEENPNTIDNLTMVATGHQIMFYLGNSQTVATVSREDYLPNNMTVTAPVNQKEEDLKKAFGMTECTWFGGASAGLNGGTRLFLCGNTNEGEENLVLWSGLNEPLYFSENCYAYVGDKDSRVTAFGKQSDMLVIFKENETYFTRYTRNNSITAEALIDQSVVDYTANSVYFPLTLIHSQIGCDLPDSIQLCRNRLVWTKTNGKVYTLVTNDQYSERNIYEVGEMAERHIKENTQSNTVSSSDWEGYYVLFCGANMYLMDYNSSGYQYIYSYQKNEDANVRIPWYKWQLPYTTKNRASVEYKDAKVFYTGSHLWVFAAGNSGVTVYWFDTNKQGGDVAIPNVIEQQVPIHSSLTTKLFDFGAAGYRKNVDTVQLMLGNNGGAPISVGFVTDCGTEYDEISLDGDDRDSYSAGHISALTLSPCIRSVLRFGVKLESDGPLIVDGMTLGYRILGGAR